MYEKEHTPSHIMELGVAYLWAHRYEAAWDHFHSSIVRFPKSMCSFYGMAGVARWCLDDFKESRRQWSDGITAKYQDAAGLGIAMPLLLFTGSILKAGFFDRSEAIDALVERSKDRRIKRWPGPIGNFLLGNIGEADVLAAMESKREIELRDRRWQFKFYRALLSAKDGNLLVFKEEMRKLVDTSQPEWKDDDFFLARVWDEDFFIARHETEEMGR